MLRTTPSLFTVARRVPELLAPANPTPHELKPLSDIDDQEGLRIHVIPAVQFYPGVPRDRRDPGRVIREALAKALVYYYPIAGRLREGPGPGRKLVVDCTGEGVVFVEADVDFTLEDLHGEGGFLIPPFPCELLPDVRGSSGIINCPLAHIQVTRFKCGGFSFALRMSHTMTDAAGVVQFMNAVAELARGGSRPSVQPVWNREFLLARDPPHVTCTHREYDQVNGTVFPISYIEDRVIERSFFFGPSELSSIRDLLQPHLKRSSTYELLSAFLWRCRTITLRFDSREEVRYLCTVNARPMLNPPLPAGYYGNAFVFPAALTTAGELSSNSLDYAVELIKKAKAEVTEEYVRSVTDFMATHGRPYLTVPGTWLVSDNTHVRYLEIDFGWGKPVYGGLSTAMDVRAVPGTIGYFATGRNGKGERGVFVMMCLPETAMERFARMVQSVVGRVENSSSAKL